MRWAVLFLLVALLLSGCSKSERFPCEAHDGIQRRTAVYSGQQPSGRYLCQDGHQEIWEDGKKTEG